MNKQINLLEMERLMRERCVDVVDRRVLLARIAGTKQEPDLTIPSNCAGFGRIRHFRVETAPGWPPNPLPGLPFARARGARFSPVTKAQLFQISGCAMRCWYCFVPYNLLAGDEKYGAWHTAEEIVAAYQGLADRPDLIVLSGGSPDIAPEWSGWMIEALERSGLGSTTYIWTDDNLTSDRLVTPQNASLLRQLERHRNYGRVCCLKGYDERSFAFTTHGAFGGFERQLSILERYLRTDLDLYGYITLAAPDQNARPAIARLMDRICGFRSDFLERIVPLRIEKFGPAIDRIDAARQRALQDQDEIVSIWLDELARRRVVPVWAAIA